MFVSAVCLCMAAGVAVCLVLEENDQLQVLMNI